MLVEQCALKLMIFGLNDQGVRLLEHVRLLERMQYIVDTEFEDTHTHTHTHTHTCTHAHTQTRPNMDLS